MNSNLDNVDLYNSFVDTATKCKERLINKYQDGWTDPATNPERQSIAQKDDDDE